MTNKTVLLMSRTIEDAVFVGGGGRGKAKDEVCRPARLLRPCNSLIA